MLTLGLITLFVAIVLAVLGWGVMSSPSVGPIRVAFYFVLIMSLSFIVYGLIQTEQHVDPRVPTQIEN